MTQVNKMFEYLGIKYYGPFDGHDLSNMIQVLRQVKNEKKPVLIHLVTRKGNGYEIAQSNPDKFHGVAPSLQTVAQRFQTKIGFSQIVGNTLCEMAERESRIVAVTAAMADGTGLKQFFERFPTRSFDVGIAEQHAVTMCAGMSACGLKPYFAVYSTFLQRGYDQIIHDVCLNKLPVTFLIDRAGAIGADGVTHQGIYDLSYLNSVPDMTICTPKDGEELKDMLLWSLTFDAPLAIRYPKECGCAFQMHSPIVHGTWEHWRKTNSGVYLVSCGSRMNELIARFTEYDAVNARFVKPLDVAFLDAVNRQGNCIITLEDNTLSGGFGQAVLAYLNTVGLRATVKTLGFSDAYLDNYDVFDSFARNHITEEGIRKVIEDCR